MNFRIWMVIITVVHLAVTGSLLVLTLIAGFSTMEDPNGAYAVILPVTGTLAGVLMQPLAAIWQILGDRRIPDGIEWLLFFLNSALWGTAGAALATRLSGRGHHPDAE